jgi:hypothetical protein
MRLLLDTRISLGFLDEEGRLPAARACPLSSRHPASRSFRSARDMPLASTDCHHIIATRSIG